MLELVRGAIVRWIYEHWSFMLVVLVSRVMYRSESLLLCLK